MTLPERLVEIDARQPPVTAWTSSGPSAGSPVSAASLVTMDLDSTRTG